MPIYAYACDACGHQKDVLQKVSDPVLTECPACGQATFRKQITAAGFQLKGGGWYATDFKGTPSTPATAGTASSANTVSTTPVTSESAPPTGGGHSCGTGGCGSCS